MSLLAALALILGLGALAVSTRWWARRRDALGRPRPFPVWAVAALTALAVASMVPVIKNRQQEAQLSRVATALVGSPVSVTCQTAGEAFLDVGAELGYVPFGPDGVPEPRTTIKREPCADLRDYVGGDKRAPTRDQVIAVHVLTHEAMHMAGERAEAATECQAMQRDVTTAQLLGATPDQARALARRYWNEVYPRMPSAYRSGECRPGGALDEGLPTAPWLD